MSKQTIISFNALTGLSAIAIPQLPLDWRSVEKDEYADYIMVYPIVQASVMLDAT